MAIGGSVVFDLLAKTGSFITDIGRAEKATRSFKKEALNFATVFKASFAGGLATGAVTEFVSQLSRVPGALSDLVKSAGAFDDIAERIGVASDQLAGFSIAAAASDTSIDQLAEFSTKLTKALSKTDDEADNTAKALSAIGLEFKEFKKLDPIQQIEALSKALAGFGRGPERTAVLEGLVKGGSQLLPFLKTLEEQGGRQNILTKEQIELADQFSDRQAKSAAQLKAYAQIAVTDALPAVTALSIAFTDFIKELTSVGTVSARLNGDSSVRVWAEAAALSIGAFVDELRKAAADIAVFIATTKKEFAELGVIEARSKDILTRLSTVNINDASKDVTAALEKRNKAVADADKALADRKALDNSKFEKLVKAQLDAFRNTGARQNAFNDPRSLTFGQELPKIQVPNFGDGGGKDDPAKKLLENQLKALEAVIKREESLLSERNRFLALFNEQGLVSVRDFYDAQVAIVESATTAQVAAIDKQLALVTAARNRFAGQGKKQDAATEQGKVDDLTVKRDKLQQESGAKLLELSIKRTEAERKFADQVRSVTANVLELEGKLSEAAAIRFDQQNFDLVRRLTAEGNAEGLKLVDTLRKAAIAQAEFAQAEPLRKLSAAVLELQGNLGAAAAIRFDSENFDLVRKFTAQGNVEALKLVDTLRKATIAQAEFNKAATDAQRIFDQLTNAEDRIGIGRQLGATTELAALKQLGDARQKSIAQLEKIVEAQDAIAKASGNPALVQQAERARIELEKLRAVADPLGDKFRSVFEDSFGDAFTDFINGTKTAGQAFKAFIDQTLQQINRIVAQNIAQSLFGKEGPLGGIGTAFGSLLGGGGAAGADAGAAAASASLSTIPAAVGPTVAGLAAMTLAAETAAAALASISGSSAASSASSFIDFGAFFAEGGSPPVGKVSVGGEQGRELWFPRTRTASETSRALQAMVAGAQPVDGMALIGQNGPQLFRPSGPGFVVPADETERILRMLPNFGGAFAAGGRTRSGALALGGEQGRELWIPSTRGMKPPIDDGRLPAPRSVGGDTNINISVEGQVTRRTKHQIANDTAREVRAAGRLS